MKRLTFLAVLVSGALLAFACGPEQPDHSEEKLRCLRGCAAQKDACILAAQSPPQITQCDAQNRACTDPCPR